MNDNIKVMIAIFIIICILVFFPIALIWSVNKLFMTGIPITFDTWLASVILGGLLWGSNR